MKVLEAEGCSGPCPGILPGLEPAPFTKRVGRGLTWQAEAATQLGAQLPFIPAGVGAQELPGDLGIPALALVPAGAPWSIQFQVHPDVEGHLGGEQLLTVEHPEICPRVVQVSELSHEPLRVERPSLAVAGYPGHH